MTKETITKLCSKCKVVKEKKDFNKSNSRLDKMAVYCKKCENAKRKERDDQKRMDAMFNII